VLQYVAYSTPFIVLWLTLIVLTFASAALGFALRRTLGVVPGEPYPKALEVAQGILFKEEHRPAHARSPGFCWIFA